MTDLFYSVEAEILIKSAGLHVSDNFLQSAKALTIITNYWHKEVQRGDAFQRKTVDMKVKLEVVGYETTENM